MMRVRVVAAVIERDGRMLVGLRPPEKRHGGLWEFPGGKLDEGETAARAAQRELAEELALAVSSVGPRLLAIEDEDSPFVIEFYRVRVSGEPTALEHVEIGWFTASELLTMPLAPADAAFASWLRRSSGDPSLGPSAPRS
jgi:mutator protein MutT